MNFVPLWEVGYCITCLTTFTFIVRSEVVISLAPVSQQCMTVNPVTVP